jgi:hypothetical protein
MRYNDFKIILEYDRSRAVQALGNSLWLAALRDQVSAWSVPLDRLLQHIVDKFGSPARTEPEDQNRYTDEVMSAIEAADPTNNKKYTQWMARQFAQGQVLKLEDVVSTLANYVAKFDNLNRKKKIPSPFNDINRYKTVNDFMNKMDEYEDIVDDSEDKNSKAKKVYADEDVTVVVPENEAAACKYGRGTRWCTASTKGQNYFDQYNRQGPMYILMPKTPTYTDEKYQLHFASGQFMDETDGEVASSWLLKTRFPQLLDFFKQQHPEYFDRALEFASDQILSSLAEKIKELLRDHLYDMVSEWESNSYDYYWNWLRSNGYVNDDEEISDNAPGYLEYDDEAQGVVDSIESAIDITPEEIREYAEQAAEGGDTLGITDIDEIYKKSLENVRYRENKDSIDQMIMIIRKQLNVFQDKSGNYDVTLTPKGPR